MLTRLATLFAFLIMAFVVTGSSAQVTTDVDATIAKDIPEDANTVVLVTDPDLPPEMDATTKSLFKNTTTALTEHGWEFDAVNYEAYTLSTKARKIRDDLFVKFNVNVQEGDIETGARLVAAARWSDSPMSEEGYWKEAMWTDGAAKMAFSSMVAALSDVQHAIMYTESTLGAMERDNSRK